MTMTTTSQKYLITSDIAPLVHYLCACTRRFVHEEFYICFKCNEARCRYCTDEEILSFYCRHCLDNFGQVEAESTKNQCTRYLQCPLCFSVLRFAHTPSNSKHYGGRDREYYYYCLFCHWNSL